MKWTFGGIMAMLMIGISAYVQQATASSVHAPVDVRAVSGDRLAQEGSTTLQLEFKTARSDQALDVMYTVDEGLTLESVDKAQVVTQKNRTATDTVRLRALRAGRLYLNVFVTLNNRPRVVSIPIQVGLQQQKRMRNSAVEGRQSVDAKGQSLIILPAQEMLR